MQYDFFSDERITRGRLPGLEVLADRFARALQQLITGKLERNYKVQAQAPQDKKLGQYLKSLPMPTSSHVFRMEPMSGSAILSYSPEFVWESLELLMGANPRKRGPIPQGREFSTLENRLLAKLSLEILDCYARAWDIFSSISSHYVQSESNPMALSIGAASDRVHVLSWVLESDLGESSLSICMPTSLLSPIRAALQSESLRPHSKSDAATSERIHSHLLQTNVSLSVRLAEGQMKVEDIMKLVAGDVIQLDTAASEDAIVFVEGVPYCTAQVGTRSGSKTAIVKKLLRRT